MPVHRKSNGTLCATRLDRAIQPDSRHVVVKLTSLANGIRGAGEPLNVYLSSARFSMYRPLSGTGSLASPRGGAAVPDVEGSADATAV